MKKSKLKKLVNCIFALLGVATSGLLIWTKLSEKKRKNDEDLKKDLYEGAGVPAQTVKKPIYEKYMKRIVDIVMSVMGIIILSPVFIITAIAIFVTDPGPVIFTQKRVGINKTFFKLYKFRSMKMSTPHDVPTHMLDNPESYITTVGKFIRKTSIDELPQLFNILEGNLSVIGPRPALWNQEDLVAERDKYCANDVMPGLTGWAQINGRDELEIPVKAKLDGEYVEKLRKNSFSGIVMDVKCFFGTIASVLKSDGVVEGGTGEMKKQVRYNIPDTDTQIGFGEECTVDFSQMKKVLITGAKSYIGESFENYATEHYAANFEIDTVDMIDGSWREKDFSEYDTVFHVAGIAHADVGNVSEETKQKYYAVNTDLAIETAQKAKKDGVKQFVFMSSMIVYGESAPYGKQKMITADTKPEPANFYGDSKWQADKGVRALADEKFNVLVLRPPMIYGKGSKGNYPTLAKLAKKLPVFPDVNNQRSMLYIENLCEFLCQVMLIGKGGIFFPQNAEYTRTADMVKKISEATGNSITLTKVLNPFVWIASKMPGKIGGLVNKAFGNSCYAKGISNYNGLNYCKYSLNDSLFKTEGFVFQKKRILFLVNHDVVIYNFRLELVERLLKDGYEVHISSPYGERIDDLKSLGAVFHDISMDRHGMNPINEMKLLLSYRNLLKLVEPDIVLGYTIKPNIYGAIAAGERNIPFIANITGLGTAVENPGLSQKITIVLYKIAFKKVKKVFFQNTENQQFFVEHNIAVDKHGLLPGSGVNLERFSVSEYPKDNIIKFLFISRIMKEKGIEQYLEAAQSIKQKYLNVEFHICGFCEAEYEGKLEELNAIGTVIYHGMIRDVAEFLRGIHCVVHPTYYPEGISNVLLEACASGRPIITTDRSGCREVVEDGINGYMIPQKNSTELIKAIDKFINLSYEDKRQMGINARSKVENQFDRQIVVEAYMREINGL